MKANYLPQQQKISKKEKKTFHSSLCDEIILCVILDVGEKDDDEGSTPQISDLEKRIRSE